MDRLFPAALVFEVNNISAYLRLFMFTFQCWLQHIHGMGMRLFTYNYIPLNYQKSLRWFSILSTPIFFFKPLPTLLQVKNISATHPPRGSSRVPQDLLRNLPPFGAQRHSRMWHHRGPTGSFGFSHQASLWCTTRPALLLLCHLRSMSPVICKDPL